MSADPQLQSALITRLPRELLDHIYLELWRSYGLRQHIFWNGEKSDKHFCHWPCTSEFSLDDKLQRDIKEWHSQLDIALGQDIRAHHHANVVPYCRRLQSPWLNHWQCGERAEGLHGLKAICGPSTSDGICWRTIRTKEQQNSDRAPYLPMLLSCKLISSQCVESIYASTTFVFTDVNVIQMFFGYCTLHPYMKSWPKPVATITPPAFYQHARHLEISLSPDFPMLLWCAYFDVPELGRRHEAWDFHWLRLDRFQKLQSIKIWMAARSITSRLDSDNNFLGVKQLDPAALRNVLAPFGHIKYFTLSTPLGSTVGPEDEGFVDDISAPGIHVYKRGTGDNFHPFLNLVNPGGPFDGLIHTNPQRQVRLARNGGHFDLMEEVPRWIPTTSNPPGVSHRTDSPRAAEVIDQWLATRRLEAPKKESFRRDGSRRFRSPLTPRHLQQRRGSGSNKPSMRSGSFCRCS